MIMRAMVIMTMKMMMIMTTMIIIMTTMMMMMIAGAKGASFVSSTRFLPPSIDICLQYESFVLHRHRHIPCPVSDVLHAETNFIPLPSTVVWCTVTIWGAGWVRKHRSGDSCEHKIAAHGDGSLCCRWLLNRCILFDGH